MGDKVVQYGLIDGDEVARTAHEAPGFVEMIAGYMVYETPHVPVSGAKKFLLFGDNEAISYAAQITEIEALRLQTTFANAVRGLLLHDIFVPAEASKQLSGRREVAVPKEKGPGGPPPNPRWKSRERIFSHEAYIIPRAERTDLPQHLPPRPGDLDRRDRQDRAGSQHALATSPLSHRR
jgi:hypothetical protein